MQMAMDFKMKIFLLLWGITANYISSYPPQFHFNYLGEKSKKHSKEDIVVIDTGNQEDSEKK